MVFAYDVYSNYVVEGGDEVVLDNEIYLLCRL